VPFVKLLRTITAFDESGALLRVVRGGDIRCNNGIGEGPRQVAIHPKDGPPARVDTVFSTDDDRCDTTDLRGRILHTPKEANV
jgi:hypothetical protein